MKALREDFEVLKEMNEESSTPPEAFLWLLMLSITVTRQRREQYDLQRRLEELERWVYGGLPNENNY